MLSKPALPSHLSIMQQSMIFIAAVAAVFVFNLRRAGAGGADYDDNWYWHTNYEDWQRQCAKYQIFNESESESGIGTRITGGNLAEPEMLPYQVGLLLLQPPSRLIQCGGALISASYILSAAHCFSGVTQGKAYLGTTRYADEASAAAVYNISRKDYYIYESYYGTGSYHDLALVHLSMPVTLSLAVQPIRLARPFMTQALLLDESVTTSGWGYTSDAAAKNGATNTQLYYVDLNILTQEKCACYFLPGLVDAQSHICTDGSALRGSCEGDSGGPLVFNYKNVNYLIGITAFGSAGGCQIGWPTVFTRITNYLNWIAKRTGIKLN